MFSFPSVFTDVLSGWIQPGVVVAVAGLFLAALRGMRTEFKEEIRASEARLSQEIYRAKEENQASEARQAKRTDELKTDINKQMNEFRSDMKEMRADNRALGEKWIGSWKHSLPSSKVELAPVGT